MLFALFTPHFEGAGIQFAFECTVIFCFPKVRLWENHSQKSVMSGHEIAVNAVAGEPGCWVANEGICQAMFMRWITSHGLGSQESGPLVMAG